MGDARGRATGIVQASWNVAPSQDGMVVRRHPETGERHLDLLKWGLLPNWTSDPTKAQRPINARTETVAIPGLTYSPWGPCARSLARTTACKRDHFAVAVAVGTLQGRGDPAGDGRGSRLNRVEREMGIPFGRGYL